MSNRFKCGAPRSRPSRVMALDLPAVDIYEFHRAGKLGVHTARVVLCINNTSMVPVSIAWEAVHFGGARPWWSCPECSARRRFLRVQGDRVTCAICLGLIYRSTIVHWTRPRSRALRRAARLRARLGADTRPLSTFPPPRPNMRPAVYTRIVKEVELCEREALDALIPSRRKPWP